jgi:hypothetical protein
MNKPNFLIIGAAKSGTTSIYQYLGQHPSIYLSPIKETNFFATNFVDGEPKLEELNFTLEQARKSDFPITNLEAYQKLFDEVSPKQTAVGEVSPLYMNSFISAKKIKSHLPDAKLIVILRNPIDRAYSGYQMQLRQTDEGRSFVSNLDLDEIYIRTGFYYDQLKRFFDTFDRNQIKVLLFEDFKQNTLKYIQEIFEFIEVDNTFIPDMSMKFNQGGIPKNKSLYNFLLYSEISMTIRKGIKLFMPLEIRRRLGTKLNNSLLSKPQPLTPEVRETLKTIYQEDILKLEKLINKELQQWLK